MKLYDKLQRTTLLNNKKHDVATILLIEKPIRVNVFFNVPNDNIDGWIISLFGHVGAL